MMGNKRTYVQKHQHPNLLVHLVVLPFRRSVVYVVVVVVVAETSHVTVVLQKSKCRRPRSIG